MKMMKTLLVSLLLVLALNPSFGQDHSKAFSEQSVTWYGVDFSLGKFTAIIESPQRVISAYLPSINQVILQEQEKKYNIKKFFNKSNVTFASSNAKEHNAKIDPAKFVTENPVTISNDDIKKLIKSYETEGRTGLGLVFVAECLNKMSNSGSYYVVFFDQATKEIVDARHMIGKAQGIGFRNFWAGSIFDVMKQWAKN